MSTTADTDKGILHNAVGGTVGFMFLSVLTVVSVRTWGHHIPGYRYLWGKWQSRRRSYAWLPRGHRETLATLHSGGSQSAEHVEVRYAIHIDSQLIKKQIYDQICKSLPNHMQSIHKYVCILSQLNEIVRFDNTSERISRSDPRRRRGRPQHPLETIEEERACLVIYNSRLFFCLQESACT